jgi:hypothetical protein
VANPNHEDTAFFREVEGKWETPLFGALPTSVYGTYWAIAGDAASPDGRSANA